MNLSEGIDSWWKALSVLGAASGLAWRYVINPSRKAIRRVTDVCDQVDVMSKSLGPNGGSSLADKIDETRDTMLLVKADVNDLLDHTSKPLWAADEAARCTRVNRAFEETFGYPHAELLGSGWLLHVATEDRERVTRDWDSALRERRAFRVRCHYLTAAGLALDVLIRGEPVVDGREAAVIGWRGAVEIIRVPPVEGK